jgi:hypothetical protein
MNVYVMNINLFSNNLFARIHKIDDLIRLAIKRDTTKRL